MHATRLPVMMSMSNSYKLHILFGGLFALYFYFLRNVWAQNLFTFYGLFLYTSELPHSLEKSPGERRITAFLEQMK